MDNQKGFTPLSKLGEFGLIKHLTKDITLKQPGSLIGIGDDACVLKFEEERVLVTTDMLIEGIHFNLIYTPLKHLGYKAAMVNFSDIFAMNAIPRQILVSVGISAKFSLEHMEELYQGIKLACAQYDVDLVGGDTNPSLTGLVISVTVIGEARAEDIVLRNGAQDKDLICVTGDLGAAYLGLQILEREKKLFQENSNFQPKLEGYDYVLERQLKPEARGDIPKLLHEIKVKPTAMIDISDGLSSEIMHICSLSDKGCKIYQDKIPVLQESEKVSEELNLDPITCALNGGEDYELLFTASIKDFGALSLQPQIHIIGHICPFEDGTNLVGMNGESIPLRAQGWNGLNQDPHSNLNRSNL
jgi:thiamine-monophosphate kinase